ncbi:MAG: RdgB/HAM1 family non-canonical purine NTP pyrophosphatase [Chloroflexi bacterium]|nr:RdgB/HAM1 family non-canonical purine NTP pyrophosphatase [Chloroflexota bacterium]
MSPPELVIATRNPGKLREFRRLLALLDARVVDLQDAGVTFTVEETGTTYQENATLKAIGYSKAARSITLADDSGIEVDALGGAPGVMSAVYTGPGQSDEQRTRHLLNMLKDVPPGGRTARYRAVLAVAVPGTDGLPSCSLFEGTCEGVVALQPKGANGFGYDPVFSIPALGRTIAELSDKEKDAISHRGNAARAALPYLKQMLHEYTLTDDPRDAPNSP